MATKTYYEPKEEAVPWLVGIDMQKFICGYGANFIGSNYVSCVAIGCQLQWGFTNNTGRPYITFPLKFSNVFTAISCICHNGSPSEANTVYNVSISGMNIGASGGGSGKYWCAFGISQPQWGKSTSTGEYVTHTFPIKFTVIPIVVAGALTSNTSGNTGSQSNPCYRSITVSNFVFCMYDNARGYAGSTYIAIGYQLQWGYTTNNNGTWALNFNTVLSAVVTGSPGYPAREFCGFNFNYTITGWSFNAGYGSPVTYLNGVCVSAIAIGF